MRMLALGDIADFVRWEKERAYPWTEKNFQETLAMPHTKTFVLDENGQKIGFAVVQVIDGEAYLQNIMVDPSLRRQGFGEQILQKVIMWARQQGASDIYLDVEANNGAAIGLYQKGGFRVLEKRKNSYPRGEDAFVMTRVL